MRPLSLAMILIALGAPSLAQAGQDEPRVTILRGASAPPPPVVVQQTIVEPRTIVEYRYVSYPVVYYLPVRRAAEHRHK